ncbi:hypothetical protein [Ruegeria lacuscaerulensis]|uniref:hypothetical protein n=1 Tax=Ruegeria lacuscaerulensis TaxID=55218 RepID=UPI00147CCFA1|nr:hypothetical protein [Ruegeria lacuscaerulensis]
MFGLQFVNYSTRILHSKDLDDMRTAILSEDDQVDGDGVADPRRESHRHEDRVVHLPERD